MFSKSIQQLSWKIKQLDQSAAVQTSAMFGAR